MTTPQTRTAPTGNVFRDNRPVEPDEPDRTVAVALAVLDGDVWEGALCCTGTLCLTLSLCCAGTAWAPVMAVAADDPWGSSMLCPAKIRLKFEMWVFAASTAARLTLWLAAIPERVSPG